MDPSVERRLAAICATPCRARRALLLAQSCSAVSDSRRTRPLFEALFVDSPVLSWPLVVRDHGYAVDHAVPGDVGESEGQPCGVCRGVVGLRREVEALASPGGRLLAHVVQQRAGNSAPTMVGECYDVLRVNVSRPVLAAEGDDDPEDLIVVKGDWAGMSETLSGVMIISHPRSKSVDVPHQLFCCGWLHGVGDASTDDEDVPIGVGVDDLVGGAEPA
jgi:hypothetical protein